MDSNRDIQAAHHIIHLFERAKANNDDILDTIPGIFCTISEDGKIFRGNKRLAELMGVEHEHILGRNLKTLCSEANWTVFNENVKAAKGSPTNREATEFELDLDNLKPKRSFVWNLLPMPLAHRVDLGLVVVLGRDVTDLKRATGEKARMEMELATAKTVQDTLLPQAVADLGMVKVAGSYTSASECGGDWWYYAKTREHTYLLIGDVVGHGVPAAILTAAVRAQFSRPWILEQNSPAGIVSILNEVICDVTRGKQSMTFLLAKIGANRMMTYVNAAHVPWIVAPGGKHLETVADLKVVATGPTSNLGSVATAKYDEKEVQLAAGDRLFFCTDGVFDLVSPAGRSINKRIFYSYLMHAFNAADLPADSVVVLNRLMKEYRQETELLDDVTFLFARVD